MKYVDIKGTQEVLSVFIDFPELALGFEYFYPDGIRRRGKTYFLKTSTYYQTPQEALKGKEETLFVGDGKLWRYGIVEVTLRISPNNPISCMKFTSLKELIEFLDNLSGRWGVDLGSLACLETPDTLSLYEHKSIGFGEGIYR